MMRRVLTALLLLTALGSLHAQESLRMVGERTGNGGGITTLNQQGIVRNNRTGRDSTVTDRSAPHEVKMFRLFFLPQLATLSHPSELIL